MCGFLGSFYGSNLRPRSSTRHADLQRLVHRGPDSSGWHTGRHVELGFRRLSIIDVDGGDQPLYSTRGDAVLTLNGEIYNHRELRAQLTRRHRFETRSDAEVLVHRYIERGVDGLVEGVNGMFAFALYDRVKNRVVLGRDRAGQKPLYWRFRDGVLHWASELKALLGDERPAICEQALNDYLRFGYVPAPLTMFEGVQKLPAGCLLICAADGWPRVRRYWQLSYRPDHATSEAELGTWAERLRDGLAAAVERRLESEVPMGFLLSGGVDSASVFALGARATEEPVQAFTIGFPGDEVDESEVAAQVARRWGAEHVLHPVVRDEAGDLGRVLYLTEEPLSTDALLPTARVFEQVRAAGFTTVLTGEGSDEIMAGYAKFASACSWVEGAAPAPTGSPLERYLSHEEFCFADPDRREELLGQAIDDSRFAELERECEELDPLGQMLQLEARLRLPDRINPRLDRLSMAWSIEARAPFMDYELQELCARMPHRVRRGAVHDKLALRAAMKPLLPAEVIHATKAPFRAPARWFVSAEQLDQELAPQEVEAAGLVDSDVVRRLRSSSDTRHHEELYSLYALHAWHRAFVREPVRSVAAAIA